jgi:AAA15 family ATPase/GTPase
MPLASLGDGMRRLLGIAIRAVRARNGYLLLDEVDSGLHHTIMEKLWTWLIEIANENNMVVSDHHPEDVEKLKEGLSKLMGDRRKRIKMRIAAQEFVQSRDEKIRAKMYYDLYKKSL